MRDEYGTPLNLSGASVVFVTADGTPIRATSITAKVNPGVNYEMSIALDSGVTPTVYKPTAVVPAQEFRLQVRIGQVLYLPIEMTGDFSHMGEPAKRTRLNLTLGEDLDGDGIPDAWERALIALLGGGLTLADIRPGDDADGDGINNLNEYLAGTFAFDPNDGFRLKQFAGGTGDSVMLEFLALTGRRYSLETSSDLRSWKPVQFRLISEEPPTATELMNEYRSADVRLLQVEVPDVGGVSTNRYFRGLVQ